MVELKVQFAKLKRGRGLQAINALHTPPLLEVERKCSSAMEKILNTYHH